MEQRKNIFSAPQSAWSRLATETMHLNVHPGARSTMTTNNADLMGGILKVVFGLTAFFGVSNFYVNEDRLKSSKILRAYGLTLLTAITTYFVYNISQSGVNPTGGQAENLFNFEYFAYWTMSLSCFATSICNQNKLLKWIQSTRQVFSTLTEDITKKFILTAIVVKAFGVLLIVCYTVVFSLETNHTNHAIVTIVVYSFFYGITMVIVLQFTNAVLFMSFLFRSINDQLSKMLGRSIIKNESNVFILEYRHYMRKGMTENPNTVKIRELSEKYRVYCSLTRDLNNCYSFQLLFLTGLCFVELTYSIFSIAITETVDPEKNRYSPAFLVIWFLTYVSLLFSFTVSSQLLTDEAKKSGSLAHKIINSESSREDKHALEIFSLQVHQSNVEITAFGLFPVNNTLIYEMVGSVSSAIVILIQFQKYSSSDGEGGGTTSAYNTTW